MLLRKIIENLHLKLLKTIYKKEHRRFALQFGLKIYPSYLNEGLFHIVGYVQDFYHKDGDTIIELQTACNNKIAITTPRYTPPDSLAYQTVLCQEIIEHREILDNSPFEITCSKVEVL